MATRPIDRTSPGTVEPSGSVTVTAWPGRHEVLAAGVDVQRHDARGRARPEDRRSRADRVAELGLVAATRIAPGRNARSEPSSVPSRFRPVAFCQRLTAVVVFASQWRLTFMPLGA